MKPKSRIELVCYPVVDVKSQMKRRYEKIDFQLLNEWVLGLYDYFIIFPEVLHTLSIDRSAVLICTQNITRKCTVFKMVK